MVFEGGGFQNGEQALAVRSSSMLTKTLIPETIREDVVRVVEDDALSMKLLEVSRNQEALPEASEETLEDAIKTETDQWQEPAQVVPLGLWVPLALRNLGNCHLDLISRTNGDCAPVIPLALQANGSTEMKSSSLLVGTVCAYFKL